MRQPSEAAMPSKKPLQNIVLADELHIDKILEQLPNSGSVLESLKASLSFSVKIATFQIQATSAKQTLANKIKRLEAYLERNGFINDTRPRRMLPHSDGSQYWWVKESFIARKVVIPAPALLEKLGILALTVWVSDPKPAPKPKDEWDWTGSFLFLPTVHYESGKTSTCLSGCSALQFIVNAAQDRPLFTPNWEEPFGRNSHKHPIEKLAELGAFVSEQRRLQSLYYVRYITNEQAYLSKGSEVRVNDVVGYPIYISAYPQIQRAKIQNSRNSATRIAARNETFEPPREKTSKPT
jgi:hypothetical protein